MPFHLISKSWMNRRHLFTIFIVFNGWVPEYRECFYFPNSPSEDIEDELILFHSQGCFLIWCLIFHSKLASLKKLCNLKAKNVNLSHFFSKHGSNGKNMSSLSIPPKALESSDSNRSLKIKVSDTVNNRAAFAWRRNSSTMDGRHTCYREDEI